MFCAFEGPPRILRVHGRGRVVEPGDAEWSELAPRFPDYLSARTVILADVTRIAKSKLGLRPRRELPPTLCVCGDGRVVSISIPLPQGLLPGPGHLFTESEVFSTAHFRHRVLALQSPESGKC